MLIPAVDTSPSPPADTITVGAGAAATELGSAEMMFEKLDAREDAAGGTPAVPEGLAPEGGKMPAGTVGAGAPMGEGVTMAATAEALAVVGMMAPVPVGEAPEGERTPDGVEDGAAELGPELLPAVPSA